jgi:hypothetical protein
MNKFFEDLGERLVAAAARRGARIEAPVLDSAVALELLELARVAAHTQERRFAPLASFMAGAAVEQMRAAGAAADPATIAAVIEEVRKELEREPPV